ncbi:MAG: hypothetical protein IK136_03130 [Oscillospiraceae bacterium]|nr:hypothetical protein [Oscillospiraceae bacterium]
MTQVQRIRKIINALLTIVCAVVLLYEKEDGYLIVSLLLSLSLILSGLRALIYYFTMARHMVDGISVLFKGIFLLDFGIFTLSISRNEGVFIAVYLLVVRAFDGAVGILRALEARRLGAASWRLSMSDGILNIAFAAAAVIFGFISGNPQVLTWLYAIGLIYSAVVKIILACRKTAIVYIQ